jgi:O-antigen/teichoic acid export membrane protein
MLNRLKELLLHNGTTRETIFKNTFWMVFGEIFGRALRFFIVVYSARILGAAEYGVFSYALTIAAFVTIFSDIGISATITREASKDEALRQKYFGAALALKGILIGLNVLLVIFGVPLFASVPEALPLLPLVVLIFTFDSLREFGFGLNRALEQMQREAFIKIVMNALIAGLGFWALAIAPTAHSLAVSYALGSGIGCLLTAWLLRSYLTVLKTGIDWSLLWPLFKMAWPVGMLGLLGAIMINTDMLMLGWWVSPEELGYYAAAQKIILLLYVIPGLFASAAFPAFARFAQTEVQRFSSLFEDGCAVLTQLSLPLVCGGILLAPQLLTFLFGSEFLPAVASYSLLLLTLLVVFPSALFANALFAFDRQKKFLWYLVIGTVSNAALNWLLIPRFGIAGAAVATIISQLITNYFVWRELRRIIAFRIIERSWRSVIATLLLALSIFALLGTGLHVLALVGIGAAVYFITLVLLRDPMLAVLRRLRSS